jgi:hypothetical protein
MNDLRGIAASEVGVNRMRQMYFGRLSAACFIALVFMLFLQPAPAKGAVITVTGNGDTIALDTFATLREAITSINNQADINNDVTVNRVGLYASQPGGTPDVINFNIAGTGVQTISVTGAPEPTIIRPLTINGYTQGVASVNTLANADNAVILIQLDGTGAGAGADGLTLGAGSAGSTIKGLDITNFAGNGIVIQSNGNSILGNFIGLDPTGTTRMPNGTFPNSGDGIRILNASNNQIGSTNPADRNITSGNALVGIHIQGTLSTPATGNIIQGNFVGVAGDGKSSVGNRTEPAPAPGSAEGNNLFGIEISGGNLNTIGGTAAGARNVVGFNGDGIDVDNGGQQNIIQGNFVGVGADGLTATANLLHGITLRSSNGFGPPLGPAQPSEPGVSFNLIGGTAAGAGNLVEFNGTAGVAVFGNPVSASGQPNVGNAIEGNSIFENGRRFITASSAPTPLLGIDLTNGFLFPRDDGLTPNDSKGHGAPNDPNNFENFPVLTSVTSSGGMTTISGTLKGASNSNFRVEFFASDIDPLGLPTEGQQFLGFVNTTTDSNGNASFNTTLNVPVANGRLVTATATDAIGNTSEFSNCVQVGGCAPTITCPANVVQNTDSNQCAAVVNYAQPMTSCHCATIACSPTSGSTFPKGTTTVTCTATDPSNSMASCTFTVTVNDNQMPSVVCPSNVVTNTDPNQCSAVVNYATPAASDNCPGATVVCSPPSGSSFPKGTTTVTCTATDTSSNTADCSFTVTVNDNQNPSITCPANMTAAGSPCAVVNYTTPTPTDNCPGATASCVPAPGFCFPLGTTTVTCTATDTSTNQAQCTFTVTVFPCAITCPPDQTVAAASACPLATGAVVTFPPPTTAGTCGPVMCTPASGTVFPIGTTVVTCSASGAQNCSFNVTVFSACLQDDSQPGNVVLFNVQTGDFSFCCGGVPIASGRGTLTVKGCSGSIDATKGDRQVHIQWDTGANNGNGAGTAFVRKLSNKVVCQITDRNMSNNTCQCSSAPAMNPGKPPKQKPL